MAHESQKPQRSNLKDLILTIYVGKHTSKLFTKELYSLGFLNILCGWYLSIIFIQEKKIFCQNNSTAFLLWSYLYWDNMATVKMTVLFLQWHI